MLELIHDAASSDVIEQHGQALRLAPRLTRPPIYIGGAAAASLGRTVRYGDGWMPVGLGPDELAPHARTLQTMAREAGRPPLEVVLMKTLPLADPPAAFAMAQAYADAGVTHLVHTQGVADERAFADMVEVLCTTLQSS